MELTAYHEAGHAIVAHHLGGEVRRITIEPEWDDAERKIGDTQVVWQPRRMTCSEWQEAGILVALAGPVAEMLYSGEPFHPALAAEWANDWDEADRLASEFLPLPEVRLRYLEKQTVRLWKLLNSEPHWSALAALADALLAHETLEGDQVAETLSAWLN